MNNKPLPPLPKRPIPPPKKRYEFGLKHQDFRGKSLVYELQPNYSKPTGLQVEDIRRHLRLVLFQKVLRHQFNVLGSLKFQIFIQISALKNGEPAAPVKIGTKPVELLSIEELSTKVENLINDLLDRLSELVEKRQYLSLDTLELLNLNIYKLQLHLGGSYQKLPDRIAATKSIINPQNKDDKCFKWAILLGLIHHNLNYKRNALTYLKPDLLPKFNQIWSVKLKNIHRPTEIAKIAHQLNISVIDTDISYPVDRKEITKFQRLNDISVSVFSVSSNNKKADAIINNIEPMFIDNDRRDDLLIKERPAIDLLFHNNHYSFIKDFERLTASHTGHKERKYTCRRCWNKFGTPKTLKKHKCTTTGETILQMPPPDAICEFKNNKKMLWQRVILTCDFEAILQPLPIINNSTVKTHKHTICSYGLAVNVDGDLKNYYTYRGPDAITQFINKLLEIEQQLINLLKQVTPMKPLNSTQLAIWNNRTNCHICNTQLIGGKDDVKDHDHYTGEFRGPAHSKCNIQFWLLRKIPVLFHNGRGYDFHFIIKEIAKNPSTVNKVDVIAQDAEKYMTFTMRSYRFIDSCQHLQASLENLAICLKRSSLIHFKSMKQHFPTTLDLLTQKGVYPYSYFTSLDKFNETQLPPVEYFINDLEANDDLRQELTIPNKAPSKRLQQLMQDYKYAQTVWDTLQCKTLGDYHDIYLKVDVLLLADIFENYRTTIYNDYQLDPAHYFTLPGLAWDGMLKKTKTKLDLLHDVEMFHFIQKTMRGGISYAGQRFAKANNPYIPKTYDPSKANTYIIYLDCNNLYGHAMKMPLPKGGFAWATPAQFDLPTWVNYIKNYDINKSTEGCFMSVDIYLPDEFHDYNNQYPPVEVLTIDPQMYSDYSTSTASKNTNNEPLKDQCAKLVPSLMPKQDYHVHILMLQQLLKQGWQITKINKILRFDQSAFMEPFITHNTNRRVQCSKNKDDAGVNLYKLLNNATYGKTMENVLNRFDGKLVLTDKKFIKIVRSPLMRDFKRFSPNAGIAIMDKSTVLLDKPMYIGAAVLELSKVIMYNYFYKLVDFYGSDRVNLIFTDTDSLCMEIQTNDFYEDMLCNAPLYDTANYPKDHKLYNPANDKISGLFKDETAGVPIDEVVALRSKCYSILQSDNKEKKTCKGVNRSVKNIEISHNTYKDVLFTKNNLKVTQKGFVSSAHDMFTYTQSKNAMTAFDNKRYILDDGINSLAYGHYNIGQNDINK